MSIWAETLPLALAIAASPFPVIPAILLLFTTRPRATGGAFLVGWALGVGTPVLLSVLLAGVVERSDYAPTWLSWTRVVLGAGLTALAVRTWIRGRHTESAPAWMSSLDEATPRRAFGLAVVLSAANPKVLVLAAAAGLGIGAAELAAAQAVVTIVLFTAIASLTVAVPWVLYLTLGDRVLPPLGRARDWLQANNAAVMGVVIGVIGVVVLLEGVAGLR